MSPQRASAPPPHWFVTVGLAVAAAVWLWSRLPDRPAAVPADSAATSRAGGSAETVTAARPATASAESPPAVPDGSSTIVRGVTVRDLSGRLVYRGDVDVAPTLARIERGEKHPHRNDGGVFRNLEGRLPRQPAGYYREYVHPTPGLDGPGPQRLVLGRQREVYYTPDHYRTFQQIR